MEPKILFAEDDPLIGTMVKMNFESEGYLVEWLTDGITALAAGKSGVYDLLVFDIMMPGLDGLELLSRLRQHGVDTPALILTAREDTPSKVKALDGGADDYLAKPFDVPELLARARALIRRSRGRSQLPSSQIFRMGRYKVNFNTREAQTNEGELLLTEKEAALLELFVRLRGQVLSRADIIEEVWGMDQSPTDRTVDNFVLRLRKLFEPNPERPIHLMTVRGKGYKLET
jgi:two-component system, OmpR family, alkaline phosphatase synthesis response regulator PhoP